MSSSVDDVEEMMCASNSEAALKALEDLRARLARMRTELSSMNTSTSRNARELRPYSPNETNNLLQVRNAPFKSSEAVELAEAEELDIDITLCREDVGAPPGHREVSAIVWASIEKEDIVDKKDKLSGVRNVPATEATLTLPSRSPISSSWATPAHPLKDELPLLLLMEAESLLQPGTKIVVSKEGTSTKLRSPLCLANPMPPRRSAPVLPKGATLHPPKDKTSPLVKLVPIRCKLSVMKKAQLTKVSTCQVTNETHSRVPNTAAYERSNNASLPLSSRDGLPMGEVSQPDRAVKVPGCPVEHPITVRECSPTHSTNAQQLAFMQDQSSKSPGEMEEKR